MCIRDSISVALFIDSSGLVLQCLIYCEEMLHLVHHMTRQLVHDDAHRDVLPLACIHSGDKLSLIHILKCFDYLRAKDIVASLCPYKRRTMPSECI